MSFVYRCWVIGNLTCFDNSSCLPLLGDWKFCDLCLTLTISHVDSLRLFLEERLVWQTIHCNPLPKEGETAESAAATKAYGSGLGMITMVTDGVYPQAEKHAT